MIRGSRFIAGLALVGAAALAGCSGSSPSAFQGTWGGTGADEPSITISADGSFNGTDGCNTFSGKGTTSGSTFELGDFALTSKACPGVDTWLSHAGSATVSGDTITVFAADGAEIGTLSRG